MAAFRGQGCDVRSVDEDPAGIWSFEAGDEAEGGGLATAGGAGEQVMAAGLDFDGQVPDGLDGSEPFAQSLEVDARHGGKGQAPRQTGEGILRLGRAGDFRLCSGAVPAPSQR
jgi:hypothetical protein